MVRSLGRVAGLPPAGLPVNGHLPLTLRGHHNNQPPPPPPAPQDTAHGTTTDALGCTGTGTPAAALAYQDSRDV